MTDKEQIMIHGVDVSECEFYVHSDYGKFPHGCSLHKDMFGLPVCCDVADCCKNCYFKQLARKTQECKQLKEDYAELEQECERLKSYGATLLADKNAMEIGRDDYMQRCKRLEQECEELKEEQNEIKKFLGISHKPIMQRLEELHERSDKYKDRILELEQECEELKKDLQDYESWFDEYKILFTYDGRTPVTNDELYTCLEELVKKGNDETNRYRKALEEIERELKEDIYCESQECGCDDYEECLRCTKNIILDIINNAKGESNE